MAHLLSLRTSQLSASVSVLLDLYVKLNLIKQAWSIFNNCHTVLSTQYNYYS